MIWAKTPAAASAMFCAACLAAAAVLPTVGPAADRLANTVSADVNLKVRFDKLANFDAIPIYQAAAGGNPTAIFALSSLSGIPAYLLFGLNGDVDALGNLDSLSAVPIIAKAIQDQDPTWFFELDSLSAVYAYQKIGAGDRTGLYDIESTNATQAFDKWAASGYTDLGAFEPNASDDPAQFNSGYAALSGANTWAKANASGNVADLAGIDAFSAIPALQVLGNPASTQADIWAAQRSLASVSAIPEYQDAPDPPVLPLAKTASAPEAVVEEAAPAAAAAKVVTAAAPVVESTPPVEDVTPAATKTTEKPSNGSYSASFAPPSLVLFGSGGGKNAADNGIRGWGDAINGVKSALGLGGSAPSAPSADAGGATP